MNKRGLVGMIVLVLIVLAVAGGAYGYYKFSNWDDNPLKKDDSCAKEGEIAFDDSTGIQFECCEGLKEIAAGQKEIWREDDAGEFFPPDGLGSFCAPCGDGVCSNSEHEYNCPEDCSGEVADSCGNGVCEEAACLAIGCPEPESPENCPEDCS